MTRGVRTFSWLAALLALASCSDGGLQKDAQGRVRYDRARSVTVDARLTNGHFTHENGCIIFTISDGRRFLPILPEGQVYSVDPMEALFEYEWAVSGFDPSSPAVKSLQDHPVTEECEAEPLFFTGIHPPDPRPSVPAPLIPPPPPPHALPAHSQAEG
jgi:hypothetical protein